MHKQITVPNEALPYILFQRTQYLTITNSIFFRALAKFNRDLFYKPAVYFESYLKPKRIRSLYSEDMANEYESIKQHLPKQCTNILDIGCGIGALNIYLYQHYAPNKPNIYLLDKTEIEKEVFYLFKERGAFYNSLELARELLLSNGINRDNIHLVEATETNEIKCKSLFDLIISTISWGFHYPVSTYLEAAFSKLNSGGTLIIDVRKETTGYQELLQKFGNAEVLMDHKSWQRVKAIKS